MSHMLVMCTFNDQNGADRAESVLLQLAEQGSVARHGNIAVLRRLIDGELEMRETAEVREGSRSETIGSVAGWLVGLANAIVGAPLGPGYGIRIGAATGNEAAVDHDTGFSDAALRELGEKLHNGESALITLVNQQDVQAVRVALENLGGTFHLNDVPPETLMRLIS